uniref:Uncharacterized protein n=1 Tax=Chromera velia CCMP2878 TaxID=1169474 RepID=A0A0G4I311_9ALVE|eukprot:Cvel_10481.t1-p1 / transcript=Cvel_10481.t1 / gene=Cvel_10481 / organism=Chromera_velia_CCMP2878 / gene_product=hypothetical protein / transcript_product=hypothetical protein / location=Cvel_scaffold632:67590-68234(-) / protein_length=215 / sequence_SO=supercontig / SO=protein_coding / is_pseudo=false
MDNCTYIERGDISRALTKEGASGSQSWGWKLPADLPLSLHLPSHTAAVAVFFFLRASLREAILSAFLCSLMVDPGLHPLSELPVGLRQLGGGKLCLLAGPQHGLQQDPLPTLKALCLAAPPSLLPLCVCHGGARAGSHLQMEFLCSLGSPLSLGYHLCLPGKPLQYEFFRLLLPPEEEFSLLSTPEKKLSLLLAHLWHCYCCCCCCSVGGISPIQ